MKTRYFSHLVLCLNSTLIRPLVTLYNVLHLEKEWVTISFCVVLFLFQIEVCSQAIIPFEMVGNTIIVEGTVNGIAGSFIIDLGAPGTLLNSKYVEGYISPHYREAIINIHGEKVKSRFYRIKHGAIHDLNLAKEHARVVDLSRMEEVKGLDLLGIIGFHTFRNSAITLDVEKRLLIVSTENEGDVNFEELGYLMADSVNFQLNGHFAMIDGYLGDKSIRLGLDTGSEVNIFQLRTIKESSHLFLGLARLRIQGVGSVSRAQPFGLVSDISIGNGPKEELEMLLVNLDDFNTEFDVGFDGILGMPFFQSTVVIIDFRQKRLYSLERNPETQWWFEDDIDALTGTGLSEQY